MTESVEDSRDGDIEKTLSGHRRAGARRKRWIAQTQVMNVAEQRASSLPESDVVSH